MWRNSVTAVPPHGDTTSQVCVFARQEDVDLIVRGAQHKKRGMESMLGSTTDHLTRHAPYPVLTVPSTLEEFARP